MTQRRTVDRIWRRSKDALWRFTTTAAYKKGLMGRATFKGNEAKRKMKRPSGIPTPIFNSVPHPPCPTPWHPPTSHHSHGTNDTLDKLFIYLCLAYNGTVLEWWSTTLVVSGSKPRPTCPPPHQHSRLTRKWIPRPAFVSTIYRRAMAVSSGMPCGRLTPTADRTGLVTTGKAGQVNERILIVIKMIDHVMTRWLLSSCHLTLSQRVNM